MATTESRGDQGPSPTPTPTPPPIAAPLAQETMLPSAPPRTPSPAKPIPPLQALEQSHATRQRSRIRTYHCHFCNHLLLATTQDLSLLPRRREPARDRAIILPLPTCVSESDNEDSDAASDSDS